MATLENIKLFLDHLLPAAEFDDSATNGMQVHCPGTREVKKIAFAVDSGKSIISQAVNNSANLLIVHHGLFWGGVKSITGLLSQQIKTLFDNSCSLYASHLPLDGNKEVGNAFELGRFLGLENLQPAFTAGRAGIGAVGEFSRALSLAELVEIGSRIPDAISPVVLPFGSPTIKKVAIATGAAASLLADSKALGADILISGEGKQSAYHQAKDLQINAVFFGHYATETFGVKALSKLLEKNFSVECFFINETTGF